MWPANHPDTLVDLMRQNAFAFVLSAILGLGIAFIRPGIDPHPEPDPVAAIAPREALSRKASLITRYRDLQSLPDIFAELDETRIYSGSELAHSTICLLVARAAVIDPRATLNYLIQPGAEHLRRGGYDALLNVWVRQDRAGALAAIAAMEPGEIKNELEFKMLHALAEQDPAKAFRVISANSSKRDNYTTLNRTYRTFLNWGYKDWDSANAALDEIKDPEDRKRALHGLASALARIDIMTAMEWAESFQGGEAESRSLQQFVFTQAFLCDAPKAQEMLELRLSALGDEEAHRLAGANLYRLLGTDAKRTIKYLTTRFEGTEHEGQSRTQLLGQLSSSFPEAAVALIEEHYSDHLDYDSEASKEALQVQGTYLMSLCKTDDHRALTLMAAEPSLIGRIDFRTMNALLGRQDPEFASDFVLTNFPPEKQGETLDHVFRTWALADARKWTEENVASKELQQHLFEGLEQRAANEDPALFAPLLIDRSDSPANRKLTRSIAFHLVLDDPAAAAVWAKEVSDPILHREAVTAIASQWLDQDSMSASQWIAEMPPGETRNEAIRLLIKEVSPVDPEGAAEWEALLVEDQE